MSCFVELKNAGLGVAALAALGSAGASAAAPTFQVIYSAPENYLLTSAPLLMDAAGNLYGTMSSQSPQVGAAYRLSPPRSGSTSWTATTLFSSSANRDEFFIQVSALAMGPAGRLYGSTGSTIYTLVSPATGTAAWHETKLYDAFTDPEGLEGDSGDLIRDSSGALYGIGATSENSVIFKLSPPASGKTPWTPKVLFAFQNQASGDAPPPGGTEPTSLILGNDGAFYGTTYHGGVVSENRPEGTGVVFKLTPPAAGSPSAWHETVLHTFDGGPNGALPFGRLAFDKTGALYGTTFNGGARSGQPPGPYTTTGVVYKLTPPASSGASWGFSVPHVFTGGADGANPFAGVVIDKSGALYGATAFGGSGSGQFGYGVIYKLTPPPSGRLAWTETLLHRFTSEVGGVESELTMDASGTLYGSTSAAVFKLTQ